MNKVLLVAVMGCIQSRNVAKLEEHTRGGIIIHKNLLIMLEFPIKIHPPKRMLDTAPHCIRFYFQKFTDKVKFVPESNGSISGIFCNNRTGPDLGGSVPRPLHLVALWRADDETSSKGGGQERSSVLNIFSISGNLEVLEGKFLWK